MTRIEFEQKFVLDTRRAYEIEETLKQRLSHRFGSGVRLIRQYYTGSGDRYRAIVRDKRDLFFGKFKDEPFFVVENKKGISVGTPYSVSTEDEEPICQEEFEAGWQRCDKRLQKIRYQFPEPVDQTLVVDFFFTRDQEHSVYASNPEYSVYAIVAEMEAVLEADTKALNLDFRLPIYLEDYLLLTVDNSDPDMKVFRSANMIDTPTNIRQIKLEIEKLYDTTRDIRGIPRSI